MSSSQFAPFFTRRAIRIKAMQALYAYYLKKETLPEGVFTWQEELEKSFSLALKRIKKAHIQYLQIGCDLADLDAIAYKESLRKKKSHLDQSPWIRALKRDATFAELREKYPWKEQHIVELWYHKTLKENPFWLEYEAGQIGDVEAEISYIQALYKDILFVEEEIKEQIIPTSASWVGEVEIFQDFFLAFIQKYAKNPAKSFQLHTTEPLSKQKEFYQRLVQAVLNKEGIYEEKIKQQLVHWDIERLQLLDRVLLKMALAEILHFPDIPKNVAMNEYLEMAKLYSTPKSHLFLNGILDAVTKPSENS